MIPVRDFSNAADMIAHYRAVNERLCVQPKVVRTFGMDAHRLWESQAELAPPPKEDEPASFDIPWYWDDISKLSTRKRIKAVKLRVADQYGVTVSDLEGTDRTKMVMAARFQAYAALFMEFRGEPHWTLFRIGKELGGKDHSSVLNGLRKAGVWGK